MYYPKSEPDAPNILKDEPYRMKNDEMINSASNTTPPYKSQTSDTMKTDSFKSNSD